MRFFSSQKEPERSRTLRYLILAAMLVPLLALARVGNLWPQVLLAGLGISAGHWYSYARLDRQSRLVQLVMFVAIHVALLWMCAGLVNGITLPQAQFAIFAQAITSFDLRYRRSLFNTLIHSLANLYIAASLSRTAELGLYLILFVVFVLAAFFVAEKEDGLKAAKLHPPAATASPRSSSHRRGLLNFSLVFGLSCFFAIFVAFVFTPRFAGRPLVPPFTINVPLRDGIKSQIINPGVPLVQINGWNDGSSDYFYGFDTNLDLRYRGGLSDEIVMYVRSPSRSYWRSHSYDFYSGESWSQSNPTVTPVPRRRRVYFEISPPLGSPPSSAQAGQAEQQIVQSFTLAKDQPNLVFAAYRPAEIFIVAENLSRDSGDGLRLPETLKTGMTYSVVSYRPNFDPALLRQASTRYPSDLGQRYLQLPANISPRVRNLAQTLTAPYSNNYDKVMALTEHLLTNYPYNFFPPPHPPGAEVVDTFLFEDREGVCEQYVTALVVMARILGIPARLATGYGSGDYNPLTGYYEVRLNHAHSWAEVYFPGSGWVPFDPTPGWTPQPYPTPVQAWLFSGSQVFGFDLPIAGLVSGGAAGLAFMAPFLIGSAVVVGLGLLVFYLYRRFKPAFALPQFQRAPATDPTRRLILNLYEQGSKLLTRRKYRQREKWETLREYAQRVGKLASLSRLTQAAEIAAYRPEAPDEEIVDEAKAALVSLQNEVKQLPT
ncbi:MAG: transglutaminase-like domain-containing protein [Anaerolineae bacterium]|nr:transglutaminase-like domain-containing protein [Anaerolineae bacterium]